MLETTKASTCGMLCVLTPRLLQYVALKRDELEWKHSTYAENTGKKERNKKKEQAH